MKPIVALGPLVSNRIAAGEVVERPASLAKELVENAIDAGATRVEITIDGGGLDRVRVSDDGCGIPADELRLAFERHATSKITSAEDLGTVGTLGFRGEALASIAAVARVELVTSTGGDAAGGRIRIEGGRVLEETPAGRARGTTLEVTGLFYNTPARRKFLRTPATEGRVLVRSIGELALAAPGVGFAVTRDGREVLDIAVDAPFRARAAQILGKEATARMVEVKGGADGIEVTGLVSASDFSRTRPGHQVLLVNGRVVSDASLAHAVVSGIGGAVPGGKHPLFALHIRTDPSCVDVNVHPTKREVRFTAKDRVFSAVRGAVAEAVFGVRFDRMGREGALSWKVSARGDPPAQDTRQGSLPLAGRSAAATAARPAPAESGTEPREAGRTLRAVGEVWGAYLVVEDGARLLIVDQHAAHERVLYDEIRLLASSEGGVPVQGLLEPYVVDLAPGQNPEDAAAVLSGMGFDARPGGPTSLLVDGIPGSLSQWGGGEFLAELFGSAELARAGAARFRDALAKSYSCKGAVKFGQRLHAEEIDYLLKRLAATDVPRLCPHGRPIYLEVRKEELDDRFERT
jgi:DNA mismatch repair protein MutL